MSHVYLKLLLKGLFLSCVVFGQSSLPSPFVTSDSSTIEQSHLDMIDISFDGSDHRLPKMLPCDWTGSIGVNIHNIDVYIPVAISINGDTGAPVKSFAQIYSFLRSGLNDACDSLIITAPDYTSEIKSGLHKECILKMTTAFEEQIIAKCPSVEKSFIGQESLPNMDIDNDGNVIIHVRSLAGDEVEHFWHIMLGELLPSISTALQLLDGLATVGVSLDHFLAHRRVTVVIHNPLRPWGQSPLHKFYQEVFIKLYFYM